MRRLADRISAWLAEHRRAARAQGLIVGLSGGVDSAVAARLAQMAAPGAVLGAILLCRSDAADERDARLVATHFGIPAVRLDLSGSFEALLAQADEVLRGQPAALLPEAPPDDPRAGMAQANLKPRLRMAALYLMANALNCLVVGTGNRSELAVGYFTKYGDGGVDLLPLGSLVKSQVRELARALGVPASIIEKPPSAGLWQGQTDEEELGLTYDELDRYLTHGPAGVGADVANRIQRLARATEHKRQLPPIFIP